MHVSSRTSKVRRCHRGHRRSANGGRRRGALRRLTAPGAVAGVAAVSLLTLAGGATATSTGTMISTAAGPFGTMLVIGSGQGAGFALYYITSDQPPNYGCTVTKVVVFGKPYRCTGPTNAQNVDWPALTTKGAPVAGPGVSQKLLGSVERPGIGRQVTYNRASALPVRQQPGRSHRRRLGRAGAAAGLRPVVPDLGAGHAAAVG
jgi:hypothetical protein